MSLGSAIALATERIAAPVEGMHRAIAGWWFKAIGPVGKPVRVVHDSISWVVHRSVRLGGAALGAGLDAAMNIEPSTSDSVRGFVDGLWGDGLGRHEGRLGIPMTVRDRKGAPVPAGPELATAFPAATGRLVVLVHGLMKTERCWEGADTRPGLIQSLEDHPALTPVAIRYNTGLRVAENGAGLASLLEEVNSSWPVPVKTISLVGHSMGGLVIRSACTVARREGYRWIDNTTDLVTIGSPHRGAPLEKLVNGVARGLSIAPHTRPLADFLNTRSQGIKDLRFGTVAADDQEGSMGADEVGDAATPYVKHHFVAGVITSNPAHPVGAVVGDLMVRPASSTGAEQLDPTNVVVLGGVHHFDLLHEPPVIDRVMSWVAPQQ